MRRPANTLAGRFCLGPSPDPGLVGEYGLADGGGLVDAERFGGTGSTIGRRTAWRGVQMNP
jgi:hypothetical protein